MIPRDSPPTYVARYRGRPDVILLVDTNADAGVQVGRIAELAGCEFLHAPEADTLECIVSMRIPTLALVALEAPSALSAIGVLADSCGGIDIVLLGTADPRVLASAQRVAESRGLVVRAATAPPRTEGEWHSLIGRMLRNPLPVERAEIERALAEHEFTLHYQPRAILEADRIRFVGVEAFVRWNHPVRGLLGPEQFLGSVEREQLSVVLTDHILTSAIRQCGQWRQAGLDLALSVNLSPLDVRDRGFPERLAALLRELDVPATKVTLDVTESPFEADRTLMLDVFTALRLQGVGLALDHFGAGFSSITELYRLPYTEIKVDGSLMADVGRETEPGIVVEAIVKLARALRLQVCASGVESEAGLLFAQRAGFDWVQGMVLCAPVDAAAVEVVLRTGVRRPWAAQNRTRTAS